MKTKLIKIKKECNEPVHSGRGFWCPKAQWFKPEPCPFINRRECDNYKSMCGEL